MYPLSDALTKVTTQIATACQECGRSPGDVRLLAVSKTQPPEAVAALAATGHRAFGENYAQELWDKAAALAALALDWVFIGHLQSNKIARLVEVAREIQTVSSLKHARQIAKAAADQGKTPYSVMIAVNAADEEGKSGVSRAALGELAAACRELPELRLQGLMTVPPSTYQDPPAGADLVVPPLYSELRELAHLHAGGGLSLGMSGDLRLAIAAGSTCVRIGTALFGSRRVPPR